MLTASRHVLVPHSQRLAVSMTYVFNAQVFPSVRAHFKTLRPSRHEGVPACLPAVKSLPNSADAADMSLVAGLANFAIEPLILTILVGGALVLAALRMLAADIDYARRWHALRDEANTLRQRQLERLRSLRPKRR